MTLSEPNPSPEPSHAGAPPADHHRFQSSGQMRAKYEARVLEVGAMVPEMLEAGVLIFFGELAPPELREIAIVHDGTALAAPIAAGDVIVLGEASYRITAVGAMANDNFAQLGHIVVKANGATETELPGEVSVESVPLRVPEPGGALRILETFQEAPPEEPAAAARIAPASDTAPSEALPDMQAHPHPTPQRRKSLWAFLNAWRSSK